MQVQSIVKCKCGYLTVDFENGASNCMLPKTFRKLIGKLPKVEIKFWACNNCANYWNVENGEHKLFEKRQSKGGWLR